MFTFAWIIVPSLNLTFEKVRNLGVFLSSMGVISLGLGVISLNVGGIWLDVGVIEFLNNSFSIYWKLTIDQVIEYCSRVDIGSHDAFRSCLRISSDGIKSICLLIYKYI